MATLATQSKMLLWRLAVQRCPLSMNVSLTMNSMCLIAPKPLRNRNKKDLKEEMATGVV